jgi:S1-C subfamily serine protease
MHEDSPPPNVEPTSVDVHGNWPTPPNAPASAERVAIPLKASRLKWLIWVFALLFAVLVAPSVAGRIQYALTAAKERAQYDFAREHHQDLNLNQISNASRLLAQFVGPSVVNVRTDRGRGEGQGSGVIVDAEGYIVTNYHVVYGVDTVEVQLSDGRRGPASVVGRDALIDVAVLKTELDNLIPAEWGDSDELAVGEMVWALGSPYGLQKSITFGILSAKERRGYNIPQTNIYQEFLQTDAAVNPGNSGGPLVNAEGQVIGINTAIIGESYRGISFAIPSTIARQSYEQLRRDGWVQRGWLGVEPSKVKDRLSRRLGLQRDQGVQVMHVEKNTPAEDAGMEVDDVILSWDGVEFSDPTLMSRAIAATTIGSEVPVEIVRRGENGPDRLTLTVTVATRPRNDSL